MTPSKQHSMSKLKRQNSNFNDNRSVFIFEVDQDDGELFTLDDPLVPESMAFCTVECPPGGAQTFKTPCDDGDGPTCSVVYGVRRVDLFRDLGLDKQACSEGAATLHATTQLTARLADVLNEMYACALFRQLVQHR